MKKIVLLLCMSLFLTITSAMASDRPLRIAIEGQYPPFNYVDKDGSAKGFEVDLAKKLCESINRECNFVVVDWDGMIPGLLAGKTDAVIASMSITEERKKSVAFTNKYYEESGSFVIKKGSGIEISKEGLKGKIIGVQRSTTWSTYVEQMYPDSQLVYFEDDNRGLFDLIAGRIDTYLAQSYFMSQWVKKPEAKDLEVSTNPVRDTRYIGEGIGIALRKDETELKNQFNEALDALLENGTYTDIASSYFDFDIYGFEQ